MSTPPSTFEDQSLKEAIRGVAGGHRATGTLRDRVALAIASESVPVPTSITGGRKLVGVKRWLAMAATIVICVAAAAAISQWYEESSWSRGHSGGESYSYTIWQSMAALEERRCSDSESLTNPLTDVKAIADEAAKKLGRRIPAPNFAGWTLDEASYCTLNGHAGIRYHLVNGTRSAAVISLPQAAYGYATEQSYNTAVDGHQIAGFVKDGGLHCIVGDRSMPLADVQALVGQLRTQ